MSDEEEDWFEAALADEESGGADGEPDRDGDGSEDAPDDAPDTESGSGGGQRDPGAESRESDREAPGRPRDGADGPEWATSADDGGDPFGAPAADAGADPEAETGPETDDRADPFGDGAVDSDGPFDPGEAGSRADPFGSDGESPFEGGSGDLFDENFGSAFAADDEFADDEFESNIPRVDIGIKGLDEMIQGGVPKRHLIVALGSAGTGKTTFGLQFLHHGLERGENAVFITLEQSREAIIDTANERGWEFDRYEEEGALAVVDLDPVEMANSLDNIRGELPQLVREFGADRLVLDSVSLLEMMYERQAKRRTEVFDFTRSLKDAGVTTFLTSETGDSNPYVSRHGIIEYLTDAVFVLQYVRSETRETRLAVEILKIRDANHSRETKPYEITNDGINVYQQANIF